MELLKSVSNLVNDKLIKTKYEYDTLLEKMEEVKAQQAQQAQMAQQAAMVKDMATAQKEAVGRCAGDCVEQDP